MTASLLCLCEWEWLTAVPPGARCHPTLDLPPNTSVSREKKKSWLKLSSTILPQGELYGNLCLSSSGQDGHDSICEETRKRFIIFIIKWMRWKEQTITQGLCFTQLCWPYSFIYSSEDERCCTVPLHSLLHTVPHILLIFSSFSLIVLSLLSSLLSCHQSPPLPMLIRCSTEKKDNPDWASLYVLVGRWTIY